ncbi:MAG: hypothetical protein JSR82_14350 [Verrucomicrobia bacterium]|nr:hypothetical protein [Verrucomicrobiota bacterium]
MKLCRWALSLLAAGIVSAQPTELARFASRPDVWPKEVVIKVAQPAAKGQAAVPAGATAKVVGLEGTLLGVEHAGTFLMVPANQTDFVEKASVALAQQPNAPSKAAPTPPAAAGGPTTPAPTGRPPHRLTALENDLVFADGVQVLPGSLKLATAEYVLLQFGGGERWRSALGELIKTFAAARERKAAFEVIMVPIPGMSVAETGEMLRDNRAAWPTVNARNQRLVLALWENFGHAGSFALCLVDPAGRIVARTRPGNGRVEEFYTVLKAIDALPAPR